MTHEFAVRQVTLGIILELYIMIKDICDVKPIEAEVIKPLPSIRYHQKSMEESFMDIWEQTPRIFSALSRILSLKTFKKIISDFIKLDVISPIQEFWNKILSNTKMVLSDMDNLGFFGTLKKYFNMIIRHAKNIPDYISNIYKGLLHELNCFLKLPIQDKAIYISKIALFSLSAYLGYSIPDMDITLFGIGGHRNFFTHSALPGIIICGSITFLRRVLTVIGENLNEEEQELLPYINKLNQILSPVSRGVAIGVSAHLFQDVFIDGSQTIRGLPLDREALPNILRESYRFDDGYLLINAGVNGWIGVQDAEE